MNNFDFKAWILDHDEQYTITQENDHLIKLTTDYGEASIQFTNIDEFTICEFSITSYKDNQVKFYLHFELNEEQHATELYDEMVETLIGLQEEKTLRVLLSCSAGLTTSMFAANLQSVAEMLNLDYSFNAVSYMSIYEEIDNYDVVLIAPQIGYMLKRLQESITDKLVLQIPTAAFASYDALATIKFIQSELEIFNNREEEKTDCQVSHCIEYENRILSIVISRDDNQSRIYYRLHDQCSIVDSNMIVKPGNNMNIYDLYDIIDTVLLKHGHIDVIGIATPGIVENEKIFREPSHFKEYDIKKDFEDKYGIDVFIINNANAAAVGFSMEHPEYSSIVYHSQPFNTLIGGQGIIVNNKVITGKNGIAGEVRFFIRRMQLSNSFDKLAKSQQGALELITKEILPTLSIIGPEALAIHCPLTPDLNEIKEVFEDFIDEQYLPEIYLIKEPSEYMLAGITRCVVNYLEEAQDAD